MEVHQPNLQKKEETKGEQGVAKSNTNKEIPVWKIIHPAYVELNHDGYNFVMKYQRYFQPGGTFFFTIVTYKRRKIFISEKTINLFNESVKCVQQRHPFEIQAFCICPDHIHMIWKLPEDDVDYPTRLRLIKSHFSHHYNDKNRFGLPESRIKKGEKTIWQRRYWEHFIRNEEDFSRHIEYIHFNPVKHGLVDSPILWKFSSFSDFVQQGLYPADWGENSSMDYLNKYDYE